MKFAELGEVTEVDRQVFARVVDDFLASGDLPDVDEIAWDIEGLPAKPIKSLKDPDGRVVVQGYSDDSIAYGQLARITIKALRLHGVDCAFCPIDTTDQSHCHELACERSASEKWRLLIAPPYQRPEEGRSSVFLTMWEGTRLPAECIDNLNRAQLLVVPAEWNAIVFAAAGANMPIAVVPLGIDTDVYRPRDPIPDELALDPFWGEYLRDPYEGLCTFGVGGTDYRIPRKGIKSVVEAFWRAFPSRTVSDVHLRIKTIGGHVPEATEDNRIDVISDWLADDMMGKWYQSLTAYVSGSPAEGFGLFPLHAMACGKPVIGCLAHGHAEFLDDSCAYRVLHRTLPSGPRVFSNPYKGGYWYVPDVDSMARAMRDVYYRRDLAAQKGNAANRRASSYSLAHYGARLLNVLREHGVYDPRAKARPMGAPGVSVRKPIIASERFRWIAQPRISAQKDLAVIGPRDEQCGVGQYGRQLAEALGGDYIPLGAQLTGASRIIIQFHPYYFQPQDGFVERTAALCNGRRVIVDIHHDDRIETARALGDTVVYHSQAFIDSVRYFPKRRYCPLMAPQLPPDGNPLAHVEASQIIAWHGLWMPHKGVDFLIEAVAWLRESQGLDVGLIALGAIHGIDAGSRQRSLNYRGECEEKVRDLGLDDQVAICDSMATYADIKATLDPCLLYCLPYLTMEQGQSSALAFGYALGKPILVSDVPIFADHKKWVATCACLREHGWQVLAQSLLELLASDGALRHYQERAMAGHAYCSRDAVRQIYLE